MVGIIKSLVFISFQQKGEIKVYKNSKTLRMNILMCHAWLQSQRTLFHVSLEDSTPNFIVLS